MPTLLSRYQHDASLRSLLIFTAVSGVGAFLVNLAPSKHPLLVAAVAWLAVSAYTASRAGSHIETERRAAWIAGALFALAQVCENTIDGLGLWWAKVLLPATVYIASRAEGRGGDDSVALDESIRSHGKQYLPLMQASPVSVALLTVCAVAAVSPAGVTATVIVLGSCWAVVSAIAYTLIERTAAAPGRGSAESHVLSGSLGRSPSPARTRNAVDDSSLVRDLSLAAAVVLGVSSLFLESWQSRGITYNSLLSKSMGLEWSVKQVALKGLYMFGTVIAHFLAYTVQLFMIQTHGATPTAFLPLFAALFSHLLFNFSFSRLWFALLSVCFAVAVLEEMDTFGTRRLIRTRRLLVVIAALSLAALTAFNLQQSILPLSESTSDLQPPSDPFLGPASSSLQPVQYINTRVHPVDQLVRTAEAAWLKELQSQSDSLSAAVTEYRRRYEVNPPPHFDKWYAFAKARKVELIDEYDTIYHSLLPYWALPAKTVRSRVREALGFGGNNLIGLLIRDGKVAYIEGGQEWQQQATVGMMEQFVEYLPDMDLAFNIHDEPRVVVPHDELSRLVSTALNVSLPAAALVAKPSNAFSKRPKDMSNGRRIAEVKTTRFNVFAHQPTWIPSRLSCSPDSPARTMDENASADNLTAYALGDLGFLYNQTAFSDICNSPSFATSHGFFDRPNAFNIVHELVPIFSQSKMSSFQDILYPSPWYWYGKVSYEEKRDKDWTEKESRLWWRGSTTGGFSRDGGWRRQHRQQFVRKVNAPDQAKVILNANKNEAKSTPHWQVEDVPREDFKEVMDVHFSHVGQCDPGDCDAQREFFDIAPPADQQDAWNYKYLLDVDGNAFSGRFYAFLKSRSLTFKMAVFREWHEEWIKPWVHYIPLSLRGDEVLEAVRYFAGEMEGKQQGVRMAEAGREWAGKALRKEDFEVWFFRLLLEYGRIVDDDRETIGYL